MDEFSTTSDNRDQIDADILTYTVSDVSDEALEAAAAAGGGGAILPTGTVSCFSAAIHCGTLGRDC
jgi:hypothetical protein